LSIKIWRLSKAKYAKTAFSGLGGLKTSGRWHTKGQRVVYCADSLSLALLELLVHIEDPELASLFSFVSIEVEIEDSLIQSLDRSKLDSNWRQWPHSKDTQGLGNEWITSMSSVILRVPSSIVPTQNNFLINPDHPEFSSIKLGPPEPFSIDPRLFK